MIYDFKAKRKVNVSDAWFRVSPLLSLRVRVLVCGCSFPSLDLAPLSRNLSFIAFLSSDRIKLGFLCFLPRRSRIYHQQS